MEPQRSARRCPADRPPRHLRWVALLAGLLIAALAHAANVTLQIEGLDGEILEAVRSHLSLQKYADRDVSAAQARRLYARAEEEIREALEPYGYYEPRIQSRFEQTPEGYRASFVIDPGEPVVVRELDVRVEGDGAGEPAVRAAVKAFTPRPGERLDHAAYEASKARIETALTERGYLDARALRHRVAVRRATKSASIDLLWASGPRYRFGRARFAEAQFPDDFLQRFVAWREGDYYSTEALLMTQQRLVDADYFSTVAVQPDLAQAKNATVPVDVLLVPARRSVYTIGLYSSTDSGPGVSLGFNRRWVNRSGHKLRSDLEYSQRLQALTTTYRIPRPGPNNLSYNFGAALRDETTDTSESQSVRLAANESREWRGYTRTLGLHYLGGDFEVGGEPGSSTLLFAEGELDRTRADDRAFPRKGYSRSLTLRFGPSGIGTDATFMQIAANAKWIRAVARNQRVILRTSLGAMTVDDFSKLPPELRFFAGGDRSIRGFDYQQLGTTNAAGEVIGGEYLAVGSLEHEYFFLPNWGVAAFVDGGDAFRRTEFDLNVGTGLGVRWKSPVGLVRVDIAKAVRSELGDGIRFHLVIGPDL